MYCKRLKSMVKFYLKGVKDMSKTKIITRTAVVLALAIVFQNLRYLIGGLPYSTIIIGSLVNLCIIVASGSIGIIPAIVVCLVTPIVALYQGHLPNIMFAPVTMIGNSVLAICYFLIVKLNNSFIIFYCCNCVCYFTKHSRIFSSSCRRKV